ncbi:coiled-coil domain containing 11 [Trypanosoma grayi]|uniref:coiled-coil domain containing 11 n=1 Tax=Trypanosoma grayi TaxID=71804 RepID=UPI0004F48B47|nr:coiled-coil domain containing 11 [Trypanosoma grayi]KEG05812.1 coiled-coil domain containing 11 [Trypanosoma grayi]
MSEFNDEVQRVRQQEYDRLQQEDKEMLDRHLAQLAAEEEQERQRKHERRVAAVEHMNEVRKQLEKRNEDKDQLDRLWDEANNKEWEKKEARWRADQQKRDKLLRNVLIIRRQQVLDKRQQERQDTEAAAREHANFLRELEGAVDIDAQERARRYALLRENQKYLEEQMQRRAAEKEASRQAVRNELTKQQDYERQFEERIKKEMENLERAKPDRYKDVPLLPKQRDRPF